MMETQACIEQSRLTDVLHVSAQTLYYQGRIKFVHSCLKEVLATAFGRFAELGISGSQAYDSHNGNQQIFVRMHTSNGKMLEEYIKLLKGMSSVGDSSKCLRIFTQEIEDAIRSAQGPMARL
jgi:hypothetical protein